MALAGAAVGVLLSIAIVRGVLRMATAFIPLRDEITVDWRVLLFAAGMGCLAAALSSLAPLWQAARTLPNDVLNEGVRSSAGTRTRGVSRSLVIAEIALAFALLAVSAVLIIQLRNLGRVRVGFDESQLITFQLTLPDTITIKREVMIPHQVRLTRAVEAIPGVNGAAFVNQLPLEGCCLATVIYPEGAPPDLNVAIKTSYVAVSPGYFQTLRLPLQSGRLLTYHDSNSNPLLVIINQAAARYFWRAQNALGRVWTFPQAGWHAISGCRNRGRCA